MQAILLAAGLGVRLKPYTSLRPKPLFPVLNQPLLHILLKQLQSAGCTRIVINAHHLAGQIEAAITGWPEARLQYEPEILGTGGALARALPGLAGEPVLVVNGDIYHHIALDSLYEAHLKSGRAVTMALHDLPRFNCVQTRGALISGFHQQSGEAGCLAYTGVQVVNPEIIARIPQGVFFHIIDLYQEIASSGCLGFQRVDGAFWQDMGTLQDYLDLHEKLLQKDEWRVAAGARVSSGATFSGWGCLGRGAEILPDARLENCVVWDGARVPAGLWKNRIFTGDARLDSPGRGKT